jgi:hypothetical protein
VALRTVPGCAWVFQSATACCLAAHGGCSANACRYPSPPPSVLSGCACISWRCAWVPGPCACICLRRPPRLPALPCPFACHSQGLPQGCSVLPVTLAAANESVAARLEGDACARETPARMCARELPQTFPRHPRGHHHPHRCRQAAAQEPHHVHRHLVHHL